MSAFFLRLCASRLIVSFCRASRSNNFYLALLLTMLFLCVLPVSYAIVQMKPSQNCGPFVHRDQIYLVLTETLQNLSPQLGTTLDIIASPSTIIPLLLLLVLIIYYLVAYTGALREANDDLRNQLRRERQEERRKMQQQRIVNSKYDENNGTSAMDRWRKVLEASSPITPNAPGANSTDAEEEKLKARREFLARIMKKALRKSSNTSEDESNPGADDDDETDTEQHESLPDDQEGGLRRSSVKRRDSVSFKDEPKVRKPSFSRMSDIVELARRKSVEEKRRSNGRNGKNGKAEKKEKHKATAHAKPAEDKEQAAPERRHLRRQNHTQDSESSASLPTSIPAAVDRDTTNYEVVNEKNVATEKKVKAKDTTGAFGSPEVFKFDEEARQQVEKEGNKVVLRPKKTPSIETQTSSSQSPVERPKHHHGKRTSDDSSTPLPASSSKSSSDKPKSPEDGARQPMKKLNSFLALVREAVHAKKQEHEVAAPEPSVDIHSRVRKFIDDSNSTTTVSEEASKASDSTRSSKRHRRIEPPKPKRQDSQTSIWSDNIPVITISKTGSDECILEKEVDEAIPASPAPTLRRDVDDPISE